MIITGCSRLIFIKNVFEKSEEGIITSVLLGWKKFNRNKKRFYQLSEVEINDPKEIWNLSL